MALYGTTPFGYSHDRALDEGRRIIGGYLETLKAEHYTLALSDRSRRYFRHDVLPSYKSHRTQGSVPEGVEDCKDILCEEFEAMSLPALEADDICGILATQEGQPNDVIIVSEDKDLRTIPGWLYVPRLGKTFLITEEEADYNHLFQSLCGDSCDGFKGCPRVGPVRAAKILAPQDNDDMFFSVSVCWARLVKAYEQRGLTEADALVQARVARILRSTEWDAANNKPLLWNPPNDNQGNSD